MLNALILAAGEGTRMKSSLAKPLHKVAGLSLIQHVIQLARAVNAPNMAIVASPTLPEFNEKCPRFIQSPAKGTGHAVQSALTWIEKLEGDVLILCADVPLIQPETVQKLIDQKKKNQADIAILAATVMKPNRYGRLHVAADGSVESIIEAKELPESELGKHTLCNSGILLVSAKKLPGLLNLLTDDNTGGEFYLTDIVKHARTQGLKTTYSHAEEREIQGINSRADLARAEKIFQDMTREAMLEKGVTLQAPETVFFSYDTQIEADVVIAPNVVFGPGVSIATGCYIKSFSHIEGCQVEQNVEIGPFARIRPQTHLSMHSRVGNFVELKNTTLGPHSKVNHLSYCGDTVVGQASNIGAGTITCNYDGAHKHPTHIGDHCFIGSNTSLVAPIQLGNDVVIAAGSTITNSVDDGALSVARSRQTSLAGRGKAYQEKINAQKKD